MKKYSRIMSGNERAEILRNRIILPSRSVDWEPIYRQHSVVFLFDHDTADLVRVDQVRNLHHETYGETWVLEFEGEILTEPDASQRGWPGAVVHRGPISLSQLSNVAWKQYNP